MLRRTANFALAIGFGVSLLIHATVIIPAFIAVVTAPANTPIMLARFDPDDFTPLVPPPEPPAEQPEQPEVMLGIEHGQPSTMTWIGYEDYLEQIAPYAAVEQAAFTDAPAPGNPDLAAQPLAARTTPQPQPDSPDTPADPTETAAAPAPAEKSPVPADSAAQPEPQSPPPPSPTPIAEGDLFSFRDWLDIILPTDPTQREQPPEETRPEVQANPKQSDSASPRPPTPAADRPDAPASPAAPSRPTAPPEASEATDIDTGDSRPEPGEHADMESDPTGPVEISLDEIKIGKPVARQGIEVHPRKPHFTTLILMTASPGNPLAEIHFGPDGKPDEAKLLQSSGDGRVDHAILASLYRWRATGKAIETLSKTETATFKIRIILNPRAK